MTARRPPAALRINETPYQQQLTDLAELLGWSWMFVRPCPARPGHRPFTATSIDGWPDLYLWHPRQRRRIHVEVKGDGGTLSPEQTAVIAELRESGAEVYVWWPKDFDEAQQILRRRPRP